jgi:hypothetical protein
MSSTASIAAVCASNVTAGGYDAGVAYSADGQVHIFYGATNGSLIRRYGSPGSPQGLGTQDLGGVVASEPSATSWGVGHVAAVLRGSNNQLYYLMWESNNNGTGWQSLGGTVTWNPFGIATAPGQMTVFYRGSNQQLYYLDYNSGSWSGHQSLGGVLTSSPVAASWGPGHLAVFTRGQAKDLYYRERNGSTWGPWVGLGGSFSVDPVAVSRGPGLLDVFIRGDDNNYYYKTYNAGGWSPNWISLGAPAGVFNGISEPGAVATQNGEVTVFARGMVLQGHNGNPDTIGVFRRSSTDGASWSNWVAVHSTGGLNVGATAGNPEAAAVGYNSWTVVSPTGNSTAPITLCTGP